MDEITIKAVERMPEYFSDSSLIDSLSQSKLDDIGMKCKTRLDQLKTGRMDSKWESEREADFNGYHMVPPAKKLPHAGYPNLACPLHRIGADTFHANVLYTFAGQGRRFTVLPEFLSKSHMDVADRAAKYLTYVLNYEADLYTALDKSDSDAEKYGDGYLEPYYVKKHVWETRIIEAEEVIPDINSDTGEVVSKKTKKKKKERVKRPVFDGIKIRKIPGECIYASPFIETVQEAVEKDYVFKVMNFSLRAVEEMAISFDEDIPPFFKPAQVKKLKQYCKNAIVSNLEREKQKYDGFMVDSIMEQSPIELAQCHFRTDVNDDGLAEEVTFVIDTSSGIVLRATYGKCRIVKLSPRPVDGRWYSESVRKVGEQIGLEWEAIHNQRVSKGQWSNLPFFFYKAGGRFNPQVITLTPGRGYPVDDPNSIHFPQVPGPDPSYFQEERLLMDYFDRILALGDVIQGVTGAKNTATETIHSQQRAGIRLSNPINRIGAALEELLQHIWELNKECGPDMKEFKVVGMGDGTPVFDKITSRDYDTMVSFKLNMSTLYDTQVLRDTALLNYNAFMANPIVMQNPAAMYELTKATMRSVGCEINIPVPEQAKAKSPFVEHDLIRQGQDMEPVIGEDVDEHLRAHMALLKSDEFKDWPSDAQERMTQHYDKTQILQATLQSANLNQSGMFVPPMGGMPEQPGFTANRNPAQTFNTMRVGETGNSQRQNLRNGAKGNEGAY